MAATEAGTALRTRHAWRRLKGQEMRCARRKCKAKRKPGGSKYLYTVSGKGSVWGDAVPECTGEPTTDK